MEAGSRVLPAFSEDLSAYAQTVLERLGVEVLLGQPVKGCAAETIRIGEIDTACRTIIWAAGVQASPAAEWLGVDADRVGRVAVRSDLSLPGDEAIFVIGDT